MVDIKNNFKAFSVKLFLLFCLMTVITSLWVLLIFSFSSTEGEKSASQSQAVTQSVVRVFDHDYTMPETIKPKSKDQIYDTILRKLAHTIIYACLGILMFLTVKTLTKKEKYYFAAKLSVPLSILVSVGDEYNQTLTEGRSGRFYDVCIDCAGILIGTFLVIFIIKRILQAKKKNA